MVIFREEWLIQLRGDEMCKHERTRCDSHTAPFYHMQLMITVISCLNCGEKLGEKKEAIGSRRKGLYSLDTGYMDFKSNNCY